MVTALSNGSPHIEQCDGAKLLKLPGCIPGDSLFMSIVGLVLHFSQVTHSHRKSSREITRSFCIIGIVAPTVTMRNIPLHP